MYKIRKIIFKNHPILGNLSLNFCDLQGNPVDTVIIAGENGTGKSTVLESLFQAVGFVSSYELELILDQDGKIRTLNYCKQPNDGNIYINDNDDISTVQASSRVHQKYPLKAIFSDVDINFKSVDIQTITSSELDTNDRNRRSSTDLPREIKQLIVDIQSIDDSETANSYREAMDSGKTLIESIVPEE